MKQEHTQSLVGRMEREKLARNLECLRDMAEQMSLKIQELDELFEEAR